MGFKFKIGDSVKVDHGNRVEVATIVGRSTVKTVGMFTLPDGGPFYSLDTGETVRQAQISTLEKLPIIFRRERTKSGEVTAVFPTLPSDYAGRYMTCYAHVGQHSGCGFDWYWSTRPAKPEEYSDLLVELRRIYERDDFEPVRLVVYQRMQPAHRREFNANLRRQKNPESVA